MVQIVVKHDGPKEFEAVIQLKEKGIPVFKESRILRENESAIMFLKRGTTIMIEERRIDRRTKD